jgi:hypothetical protein
MPPSLRYHGPMSPLRPGSRFFPARRPALAWALALAGLLASAHVARAEIPGPVWTRPARAGELDLRAVVGAAVNVGEQRLFFDQVRDRHQLPHLQVEIAFAQRVAIELDYSLLLVRFDTPASGHEPTEDGYGSGDLRFRSRFIVLTEGPRRPGVGVELGVKLPNARARAGYGTDETDVHGGLIVGKRLGPIELAGAASLAILGDPTKFAAQDDVVWLSGLVVVHPSPWLRLLAEVWGMPRSPANAGRAVARGGAGFRLGPIDLSVTAGVGMTSSSPRFVAGLDLGFDGPLRRQDTGE